MCDAIGGILHYMAIRAAMALKSLAMREREMDV